MVRPDMASAGNRAYLRALVITFGLARYQQNEVPPDNLESPQSGNHPIYGCLVDVWVQGRLGPGYFSKKYVHAGIRPLKSFTQGYDPFWFRRSLSTEYRSGLVSDSHPEGLYICLLGCATAHCDKPGIG